MSSHARADELLADRALQGLDPREQGELEQLLAELPDHDTDSLDHAAAALDLALGPVEFEPLPAGLQERLKAVGEAWSEGFAASAQAAAPRPGLGHMASVSSTPPRSGWGWWAAAAAGLMAIVGWWPQLTGSPTELRTPVAGVEPERGQPTASELRAELLAASDALRIDWTATDFAAGATGDVVWSQADQRGFLRIEGLAVNDPTELQYQLWIFDDEQEHPVDGGVFDIGSDGEVIVPIDAKLTVAAPTLFAVTIEKPGGVVVSDQQRIALVGQV